MPNHHSKKHKHYHRQRHSVHTHRTHHHSVSETPISPPPNQDTKPSAFAKLRVILLLVVLVMLVGVLFLVWNIFRNQERADYVITGEDLFRSGIADRIFKEGPAQSPPPVVAEEVQEVQQRASAPSKLAQGEQTYFIRTSGNGPTLTQLVIDEFDPAVGTTQGIAVQAEFTQPIETVTATLQTDTKTETYNLSVIEGDATKGVWSTRWPVTDTHDVTYTLTLQATSPGQPTSKIDLSFR